MPLPSTVGQKTKKNGDQSLSNILSVSRTTKNEDEQTSWKEQMTRDTNMVIKSETNFLYLRWPLSTTSFAESLSPWIRQISYYLKKFNEEFLKYGKVLV